MIARQQQDDYYEEDFGLCWRCRELLGYGSQAVYGPPPRGPNVWLVLLVLVCLFVLISYVRIRLYS